MKELEEGGFMGIKKSHKGWCTPMTKSTCTGARRRLAKTLKKHHGFHDEGGEVKAEYGLNYSPQGFMNVDPPIRQYDFSSLPLQGSNNFNTISPNLDFNTSNIPLQSQGSLSPASLNYGYDKQTTQQGYLFPYIQGINMLARGVANQKNIADSEKQRRFTDFDNQQPEEVYFNQAYRKGTYATGGPTPKSYNPNLASRDKEFQDWYNKSTLEGQNKVPYSESLDYDYYSFYRNKGVGNPIDHFPDTYKRPNHKTFSNESIYSTPENPGGRWQDNNFIPKYSIGGIILDNALPKLETLDFNTPQDNNSIDTSLNPTPESFSIPSTTQDIPEEGSRDLVNMFKHGITGPETGGVKNYNAKNKNSTAYGAYQFLQGTRLGIYNKYMKEQFSTPQEFEQNYKSSPDVQEKVMDFHSKDLLNKFHGNLYAAAIAHFAGDNAAEKYLEGKLDINKSPTPTNNITYKSYLTRFSKSAGLPAKFKKGGIVEMDIEESQIEKLRNLGFNISI